MSENTENQITIGSTYLAAFIDLFNIYHYIFYSVVGGAKQSRDKKRFPNAMRGAPSYKRLMVLYMQNFHIRCLFLLRLSLIAFILFLFTLY